MRTETLPPIQGLLVGLHEQLALNGDEAMCDKHRGHGIHEHNAEPLCQAIMALLKGHSQ